MKNHHRDVRKIDPNRGATLGDGSPNINDRQEIGPTTLAFEEWKAAELSLPNLENIRAYRHKRLVDAIAQRGYGGLLVFDPLNIRYATDSTNMQLFNTHNPFRALLVCADGYMVIWEYHKSPFLTNFNTHVSEVRAGGDLFYLHRGDQIGIAAEEFSRQVHDLIANHSEGNMRLAVDKIMVDGLRALEVTGFTVLNGEEVTEKARSVKSTDEIKAMRCAINGCEAAMHAMEAFARANVGDGKTTENDIWSVLHAENIRRGGEWIETRLLTSGPRTNPWFQECGQRVVQNNEVVAFDTDLVGCYGFCVDISRTWWIGDKKPSNAMIYAMRHAHEHIMTNMSYVKPGLMMPELVEKSHRLDAEFQAQKYGCIAHGVGLCDEWPVVTYPDDVIPGSFDYPLEAGMVLSFEALVSPEGGDFSIKLEDQILVTENGFENLTTYPFDPRLMGD